MSGRTRRAIGSLAILAFLVVYVVIAATIGEKLQDAPAWALLAYYAIAGIGWGLPLKPLFDWMNKPER